MLNYTSIVLYFRLSTSLQQVYTERVEDAKLTTKLGMFIVYLVGLIYLPGGPNKSL